MVMEHSQVFLTDNKKLLLSKRGFGSWTQGVMEVYFLSVSFPYVLPLSSLVQIIWLMQCNVLSIKVFLVHKSRDCKYISAAKVKIYCSLYKKMGQKIFFFF